MDVGEEGENTPTRVKIEGGPIEEESTKNDENTGKDVIEEHR